MVAGTKNRGGYAELLEMAKKHGLKVQAVKGHGWLGYLSLNFYGCW